MLPIEAIWQHYRTPDSTVYPPWPDLTGGYPVWWGERKSADQPQTVLSSGLQRRSAFGPFYELYTVQVSIFHPSRATAEAMGLAAADAYNQYSGVSSSAPGLTLGNQFSAEQVQAHYHGVLEALPITGGRLFMAVTMVTLTNLHYPEGA